MDHPPAVSEVAAMNRHAQECMKRAAECVRLAEATGDAEMKTYLTKLALSWVQAAGETVEREL
jgi:hypothetical protein